MVFRVTTSHVAFIWQSEENECEKSFVKLSKYVSQYIKITTTQKGIKPFWMENQIRSPFASIH